MNISISDTFDNISFSASGQLINKDNNVLCELTTNNTNSINKEDSRVNGSSCLKISFDDSAFLNDSFSFTKNVSQHSQEIDKENIPITVSPLPSTTNLSTKPVNKSISSVQNEQFKFSESEDNKLSILGLPAEILQKYECRNVTRIFPWQLECLSCNGVLEGKNLVYSAPTSAGKTLVAEILAAKTVLERNKKVIFILPFVSVVREKMFYFQDIFGSSGIRVEGFMGSYNPPGGYKNINVAICTIEKANSLINRLLDEGKIGDIGAVIVDELHLIGDSGRGYLLELLLTKLNYISRKDDLKIQIVGMSATLPNLDLLGKWLDASLYITTFRPIPLNEQCLVNGDIFNSKFELKRRLDNIPELEMDTDNILQLCLETLLESCSVLVFCPTKNWCENLAVQIASAFFKIGKSDSRLGEELRNKLPVEPIRECLEQLKRSPAGLDDVLQKTVSFGVAFHHAGLTMDERDIIEGAFRTGGLRVLVATSTLSSGVNLPARRVIIRSPTFFGKPIDVLSYKQMVGRAGRMGRDTSGESILICQKKDLAVAKDLMSGELEAISSCLEGSGRLKRALLEVIASQVASTPDEIDTFGKCTLLNHEGTAIGNPITDALDFLMKYQFIRLQVDQEDTSNQQYVATPLAKACLNSSMPPEEGLALFAELEKARQCFVLETELHLIYLVTPFSVQIQSIDWMQFLELWEKLPASMKRVGELVGIKVSFIINCSRGKAPNNSNKLAVHRRFYTALALQDLVNEVPLNQVAQRFGCNRGALQSLQQSAATFAGMVTSFSKQLGWSSVELLIGQFQDRLQFGVSRELLDLMRLPILNGQRARVLFNAGVENLVDLAGCNVLDLENILHKAKPFESKEREGESKHDAEKRNNLRTIFITGKRGLTELEAAGMMIEDARKYLQYEIGLSDANWSRNEENVTQSSQELNKTKADLSPIIESPNKTNTEENKAENSLENVNSSLKEVNFCDLTSLRLSSSSDSMFNDSFTAQMKLVQNLSDDKVQPENPPDNNSDSLLTKAFMDSFNESLTLRTDKSFVEDLQPRKRPSDDIKSTDSSSNSSVVSEDDMFTSPIPPKLSRRSKSASDHAEDDPQLEIINVCDNIVLFKPFIDLLATHTAISLSLACEDYEEEKQEIGIRKSIKLKDNFTYKSTKIHGLAVYWPETTKTPISYYIELEKLINMEGRDDDSLKLLETELMQNKTLRMFNVKEQLKLLHYCLGWKIDSVKIEDPRIADWILDPESHEKTFSTMVKFYSPCYEEQLDITSCKVRASMEALINWSLIENVTIRLTIEDPQFITCYRNEMQIILILTKMELNGMPVNLKTLQSFVDSLKCHLQSLESEAFNLAGRRFSFTSSAAVSKVLNMRGSKNIKSKRKISTNKAALVQYGHPLAELIIQWRKINSTLTKMVYPLLRNIEESRIRGVCITQNSTGRVSMHEPNVQNVPRDFQFIDPITNKTHEISLRSAFSCLESGKTIIVSADYCQLELRILAHLSKDSILSQIMCSDCDIFKAIAAKWMKISEEEVDDTLRQQTKQICYGIIYGIGNKTLADQMSITENEALEFTETFHQNYPGIRRFIKVTIDKCVEQGYVETLLGRRRYLSMINSTNQSERSKAERQAVNTTVQGSAADIAKQAMILVDRKVCEKFRNSRNAPKLILQLHDELLYEVPLKYEDVFARILKKCMQESVKLDVPLPVKVKSGKSWGTLVLKH